MAKYIPKEALDAFFAKYQKDDVWQIHQGGDALLNVFLYKEDEIEVNRPLIKYVAMREDYLKLVKEHLDSPSSEITEVALIFDSKENFEQKYNGNWYEYYH